MKRVAIALGTNLGNRHAALTFATSRIATFVSDLTISDYIETEPEGEGLEDQPLYLNAVAVGNTSLTAREVLEALLRTEREFGRQRPYRGAPRTLDLDLILLGDEIVNEDGLQVPHPRFRTRFFVLGPLAQVAPEMIDPVSKLRVGRLLRDLLREQSR